MISSIQKTILFIHLLCLTTVLGQEFSISGKIIDENKIGIEGTEILLLNNGNIVNSALTDSNGNFLIKNKPGIYSLRFYFVGTVIYQTDFNLDKNIDLGILESFDSSTQLREVEVTSKKRVIENKVDRTVFNVENSIRSTGTDGFELLKTTPGVFVSGNTVGIVGKSTVSVMINDRIINLSGDELNNYLRSINSENIKSIEVITTPPAKYDAQGNSGLINIKLKKVLEDSWAITLRNTFIQTSYPTIMPGINFVYNKNKFSLFTDFAKREGHNRILENFSTEYTDENWIGLTKRKDKSDIYRGIVGMDYKVSEKTSIGVKYVGLFDRPDITDRNTTEVFDKVSGNLLSTYFTHGFNDSKDSNNSVNAYYIQKIDTLGKQFSIDIDYFNYIDDQNRIFSTENVDSVNNIIGEIYKANNSSIQNITNYSAKIDFEIPTKWVNYSFGSKLSFVQNTSDIKFYDLTSGTPILDILQTNLFDYDENTQSAYVNFSKKLSEKWQTQIGFRYENSQINGSTISEDSSLNEKINFDYGKLFPSAYLLYTPNENHSFSINYSKRISRPIFWDLNPFKWYLNSFTVVEGNPLLQPSFADNFEFNYGFKDNFTFKLYYSNTTDGSMQIPFIDLTTEPANIRYFRDNFYDNSKFGATFTYLAYPTKWWESSNTLNGHNNVTRFTKDLPTKEKNGFIYSFYTYNTFTLNKSKSLMAEVNFEFNSARKDLYYEATQYNKLDAGLRYTAKETGLSFLLLGTDLLRSYMAYFETEVNNTPQKRNLYMDERMLRFGITYKFGNKKLLNNQRESGNEEVQERLK